MATADGSNNAICIACDPRYIPIRDKDANYYSILFCQSTVDNLVYSYDAKKNGIAGTNHPGCIYLDAPVKDIDSNDVNSCKTCQLPYVRVKVGIYQDSSKVEQPIYGCAY